MTWVLWGISGSLLCLSAIIFVALAVFRLWSSWTNLLRALAVASWANQLCHGLVIIVIGVLSMRVDRWGVHVAAAAVLLGALTLSGGGYAMIFDVKPDRMRYVIMAGAALLVLGWSALVVTLAFL